MKFETHRLEVGEGEEIAVDWYLPDAAPPSGAAVFVHGFASDRKGEKAVFFAETLTGAGWGLLSIDLRGHGDSSGGLETLTLTRSIEDLAVAVEWLPLAQEAPVVLIGSSMGGAVTAWYTLRHPHRARAVAWIAPSLTFPVSLAAEMPEATQEAWKRDGTLRYRNEWLDVTLGYGMVEDGLTYDYQQLLSGYRLPTLIFHGLKDDAVPWRASVEFLEAAPNEAIDLALIKEGDHRLTDQKAYLGETLTAWLRRQFPGAL